MMKTKNKTKTRFWAIQYYKWIGERSDIRQKAVSMGYGANQEIAQADLNARVKNEDGSSRDIHVLQAKGFDTPEEASDAMCKW